ncbi:MAG: peptidoglycan-binding protein [Candidatus Sungbacteria bacterium]|nr:peptidoglycan-binding protein [Candidatus Sungbacteria bacterium]
MNILPLSGGGRFKKVAALATAITISGAAIIVPLAAVAQTSSIDSLMAQIAALQAQINALHGGSTAVASATGGCTFARNLKVGSRGDDVTCLQNALIEGGYLNVTATGYFGSLTKAGVVAWQRAAGVSPTSGYFGLKSRAAYSSQVAATPATPATPGTPATPVTPATPATPGTPATPAAPVASGLTVMLDANQPVANLAPGGAARVPFTRVKFTASADGDVMITGFTAERKGPSNDAALDSVVLLDENGAQLGLSKTLNSLHQVLLNEPVKVAAGTTRTLTIAGNMTAAVSTYNGQVIQLALVGVNAGTTAVTGVSATAPLVGNGQTYNSTVSIGTVTMQRGSTDPGVAVTKNIGQLGYTFSAIRLTAGSAEKVYLKYIRWNQTGSVASGDLANIKTYVDGTAYDTVVSSDGKYYVTTFTDNSGQGILVDKGFSKELSIKGDITGGSGRTVIFDIAKKIDIGVNGQTYGFGILPPQTGTAAADHTSPNFTSSEDPWYAGGTVTVSAGTISISSSNSVAAQNIAVNVPNVPLGAFTADVRGEPITVNKVAFNVALVRPAGAAYSCVASDAVASNPCVNDLTNVTLVDENGSVIAGPVDGGAVDTTDTTGASNGVFVFSTSITFPVGLHTYTLKGRVGSDLLNNTTIQASTTPSADFASAKGQNSGNSITPSPAAAISMNTMTVKTGALTVSVQSVPVAQTVIAGALQFEFARYNFDTTASGEDVRVSSVPLYFNAVSGNRNDLTNCQLYDGATSLNTNTKKNPASTDTASSTSITFDGTGLVLSKGASKTLSMKCDVRSGSTGVYQWGIDNLQGGSSNSWTGVTGLGSGQTISETVTTAAGQQMTASSGGSLSAVLDTNSPGYVIVAAGTTGVELGRTKFSALNEDIDVKQIALKLTGTASNTQNDLVNNMVTLYDADTMVAVGTAVINSTGNATSSLITSGAFRVPKGGSKTLVIKGDMSAIGPTANLTRSGDNLIVDYDTVNTGLTGTYGTGVASGATITPTGSSANNSSAGVRIMRSYPIVTYIPLTSTEKILTSKANNILYKFSVQAKSGDVAFYKFQFAIGSSTLSGSVATTSAYALYAFTDSGFSIIDSTFSSTGLINAGTCFNGRSSTAAGPQTVSIYPDKTSCNSTATTTYIVPNGLTRYFQLRATAANVSTITTSKDTITVNLNGSAAYPVNTATLMSKAGAPAPGAASGAAVTSSVDADTNNQFIWSPISTTTQNTIQDLDFTNGYQVMGLPALGTTQESLSSQ